MPESVKQIKTHCDCHDVVIGNCSNYRDEVRKIMEGIDNKTTKHTKLPWKQVDVDDGLLIYSDNKLVAISQWHIICNEIYKNQVTKNGEEASANAKFIIRAVNNHYELVEALKSTLHELGLVCSSSGRTDIETPAMKKAKQALKNAEGN